MLLREKIAYLLDILQVKHESISHKFGITRQAFSKRLKSGNFSDVELEIIARELNMNKETIENTNPKMVVESVLRDQLNSNGIALSYVVNVTFSGGNEESTHKLLMLIKELNELNEKNGS